MYNGNDEGLRNVPDQWEEEFQAWSQSCSMCLQLAEQPPNVCASMAAKQIPNDSRLAHSEYILRYNPVEDKMDLC